MTITSHPTTKSNFHVSLKDSAGYEMGLIVATQIRGEVVKQLELISRTNVDRTALKTSQGDQEYSDFTPPYYAMKQDDFSGGRGLEEYKDDRSRYRDGIGLCTRRPGYLHLNAQEQFSDSALLRKGGGEYPTDITQPTNTDSPGLYQTWAVHVEVSADGDYDQIWIYSFNPDSFDVTLYDGADAEPTTVLQSGLATTPPASVPGWHVVTLDTPETLAAADGVYVARALSSSRTWLAEARCADIDSFIYNNTGGSWSNGFAGFACRVLVKTAPEFGRFFEYKQALYYVQFVGGAVKLWMNGYRGVLSAGATGTATDSSKSWTTNELAGAIFKVTGGTGINEARRWRRIASNTGTVITFEDGYTSALSTDTEYVVLGTDVWTAVTGHGLTNITDVLVGSKGVVYFAQGSTAAMRRMREYNNAGTWTREFAADSTNQANYLVEVGTNIWRVQNTNGEAASAASQDWGTDLTFGTGVPCGDETSAFTGLDAYQDESGAASPFVFKEEIAGFIETYAGSSTFIPLKIKEMASLRSEKNGRAHLVFDTKIFFSLGDGLEQYFSGLVDDIGPNKEEGMPTTRQGPIVTLRGYPGRFYAGIDAGAEGYSTVLSRSGGGWHEEWTGPYGMRMFDMYSQPIPGTDNVDRMWLGYGGDITWMPIALNPLNDPNYLYTPAGYVESAEVTTEMKTASKYLSALKLVMREAGDNFEIEYKINDGAWTDLYTWAGLPSSGAPTYDDNILEYNLAQVEEFPASSGTYVPSYGVEFFSLQYRVKLGTEDQTASPVVRAVLLELMIRIENKYAFTIPFILEGTSLDPAKDLLATNDDIPAASTKLDKLIAWSQAGPLYMRSMDVRLHNRMVILIPFAENIVEVDDTSGHKVYLGQLTLQDA